MKLTENDPSKAAADKAFYQSIPDNQREYLDLISQDMGGEITSKSELEDLAVAYSYFRQLPAADQQSAGRLITQKIYSNSQDGSSIKLSAADQAVLDGLSPYEKEVYRRIKAARASTSLVPGESILMESSEGLLLKTPKISATSISATSTNQVEVSGNIGTLKSNAPVSSVSLILADENGQVVSRTTTNSTSQFQFDRVKNGQYSISLSNPDQSTESDPIYVNDLNLREISVDNILAANENSYEITPTQLSASTLSTYQNMSRSDQKMVDRLIAFDYLTLAYSKNSDLKKSDKDAFRDLISEEQRFIKILAMDLKGEELSEAEQGFLSKAFVHYYNLAPSAKATFNRIVADMVFGENSQGSKYRLSAAEASFRNDMSPEVGLAFENIKSFRFNNERILSENLDVESRDLGERPVVLNIPGYTNQQYSRLNITGRLINTETGSPVSTKALRVVDNNGNMIARTFTGSDGRFKFNEIRAGNYKVELEQAYNARIQNDSYFVKDLEITGTEGSKYPYQLSFNIHFDFNSADLRPEAKQALFDVIEITDKNELFIELRAHTDAIGNDQYNDELSGKRGIASMDFLGKYGIPDDHMTLLSLGKNEPVASNKDEYGRQFNRRVEVILKSLSPIDYLPPNVYIIRPKATLYSIAKNFNLTIEEIMKTNGLTEASLVAYKPIRILNPMNYKPNLDMLVELNTSVNQSNSFKYTVKNGETTTSIAEKFNLPEELLLEMNNLNSQYLDQGQVLNIYVRF